MGIGKSCSTSDGYHNHSNEDVIADSGSYSESYSDHYSCVECCVQTILSNLLPKFTAERLESEIESEKKLPPSAGPVSVTKEYDVNTLKDMNCRTHVIGPKNGVKPEVVVLYYHGGAYVKSFMGNTHFDTVAKVMKALKVPSAFVLPEYPLVPNVTHESLFDLIEENYRQVLSNMMDSAAKDQKIVLMGDSAGGGMALILAQRLSAAKRRGDPVPQPDSVILMSPWLDVSMSDPHCAELAVKDAFLAISGLRKAGELLAGGTVSLVDPKVSPLYGPLEGLPPVGVWTGTHDMLLPDSRRLRDRYRAERPRGGGFHYYEKKGLLHCYFLFPGSGAAEAVEEVAQQIRRDCRLN